MTRQPSKKILSDIKTKSSKKLCLREETQERRTQKNQPKCLNLQRLPSPEQPRGIQDIVSLTPTPKQTIHFEYAEPEQPRKKLNLRESLRFAVSGMAIVFMVNIINVFYQGLDTTRNVTATALQGFDQIISGGSAAKETDFLGAQKHFAEAQKGFDDAKSQIWFLSQSVSSPVTDEKLISSGTNLLEAGKKLAYAGETFIKAIHTLNSVDFSTINNPEKNAPSLTETLKQSLSLIEDARTTTAAAQENLSKVSTLVIPPEHQETFKNVQGRITTLLTTIDKFTRFVPATLRLLGDRYPHRYLVLFQNNTEARPTGGFIGSYAIVDINDGYITNLQVHDVYDADGQLHEQIEAPEEIAQLTDNWRLRDSNYSPDFTISAQKAAWFLEKQKGPGVDSIIAINQSTLRELLKITGPITLEGLPAPLTAENYNTALTYFIESKHYGATNPKEILKQFVPKFQETLFASKKWNEVATILTKEAQRKNILAFSKHEDIQAVFDEFNISGRVLQQPEHEDYLMVTASSVGGNKSDLYIDQTISHQTSLEQNGDTLNKVTITRAHRFNQTDEKEITKVVRNFGFKNVDPTVLSILGKAENKAAMKIYVPKGSTLLNVDGAKAEDIVTRENDDLNKTYFYFFMDTPVGEKSTVTLTYKLPFKSEEWPARTYRLHVEKQPGFLSPVNFEKKIFPQGAMIQHSLYPAQWQRDQGVLTYRTNLRYNRHFAGLWGY